MTKVAFRLGAPLLVGAAMLLGTVPAPAQDAQTSGPTVYQEIKHDVSQPLWVMAQKPKAGYPEANILIPENLGANVLVAPALVNDPVGDDPAAEGAPMSATQNLLNFEGISQSQSICNCAPPDTEGAVGATQFVQYVNTAYEVYNKTTGASVLGPLAGNSFWSGFGGSCQNNDDGDPIVMYDKAAQRWVFAQNVFVTPYTVCIAVSTTSDATGSYYRYSYSLGSTNFPDYPKWGVWPDGYYQSFNNFKNGITLSGSEVCAADRNNMLVGNAAPNFICFTTPTGSTTNIQSNVLPSDLDGNTAPPTGAPNYYVGIATSTGNLNIYQFHSDFVTPTNSTFNGPTLITTAPFNEVCPTTTRNACIVQPSGGEKLEGLSDRLMYRLNYRNFGTYESLLVTHTVTPGAGSTAVGAARWYEIRSPGSSPTVFQQATTQAGNFSIWMGSIAQDKNGDIALGVSGAGTTLDPSVLFYVHASTDPRGKMEAPQLVIHGGGVQQNTSNRWGDYSDMTVDPTDDCTFWYTQEYEKTTGSFNWHTRINSFKFPGCS